MVWSCCRYLPALWKWQTAGPGEYIESAMSILHFASLREAQRLPYRKTFHSGGNYRKRVGLDICYGSSGRGEKGNERQVVCRYPWKMDSFFRFPCTYGS